MWKAPALAVGIVSFAALLPNASSACTPSPEPWPAAPSARAAFDEAAVVLDAEVVEVNADVAETGGATSWGLVVLKPMRVWKGPSEAAYRLSVNSSCDVDPEAFQVGGLYRLLLRSDGDGYHADMGHNGLMTGDIPGFNTRVDDLVGAKRPPGFQPCLCMLPPPIDSTHPDGSRSWTRP